MSVSTLFDTNIIIYTLESVDLNKYKRAKELVQSGLLQGNCCISRQVMQETLNVAKKKLQYTFEDALYLLHDTLLPLCRMIPMDPLHERGLFIKFRYQYSFYDSLIIAAALEAGCKTLYSEDMQHGQRIEQLIIKNPFLE